VESHRNAHGGKIRIERVDHGDFFVRLIEPHPLTGQECFVPKV